MPKARKLQTNFSAGELSPRLEGRPDLAKYFNGVSICENYLIFPQGGLYRAPGTRYVGEVKDSTKKVRLIPFIVNRKTAYVLEVGENYIRVYRNGRRVESGGSPVEITTTYTEEQIFDLNWAQSIDVNFFDHPSHHPAKISRSSDTIWAKTNLALRPPPSFEDRTDLGTTLTPAATTGTGIAFTAGAAVFLTGDIDRSIMYGTSRAVITALGGASPHAVATCDILDAFPDTNPIASGEWFLDKSPSSYAKATKKKPVGGKVTVGGETSGGAGQDTFRSADVGKFIKLFGGLIEITEYTNAQTVKGIIRATLSKATSSGAVPEACPGGDWTLEVAMWDTAHGFPAVDTFYQGRLIHAANPTNPTTWVGSASDSYENYAVGALADYAIQYTITSRQLNAIRWLADLGQLFIGTEGAVFAAKGPGVDQPLGGDTIPFVRAQNAPGTLAMAPVIIGTTGIYVQASGRRIIDLSYNFDDNAFRALDLTRNSEHICGESGIKQDQIAWAEEPNRHLYFIRNDGQLVCLTYFRVPEDVVGFTRRTTDGIIESHCVIPHPDGDRDQTWWLVKRTINGIEKRYIEIVEDCADEFSDRDWQDLQTDCAFIYNGAAITHVTGLDHLEGKTVDVIADGSYKGQQIVTSGALPTDLSIAASSIEIGLHYKSTCITLRPAMQDSVIEGVPRRWDNINLRVKRTLGGKINGEDLDFSKGGQPMDHAPSLVEGDIRCKGTDWDTIGKVTIEQDLPYPQEILCMFGELSVGERL
jgi:hypothetical protein